MSSPKPAKVGAGLELKQRIEDEYKNWMVAAPQIYDVCMAKRLKWPSLTCDGRRSSRRGPRRAACCVFDTEKAAAEADAAKRGPAIMLRGHGEEGYGLAWNPHVPGELYTVANDGTLCGWDVAAAAGDATTPSWFAQASEVALSDVAFTPRDPWTLGAVGDDRAVQWSPHETDVFAAAGADRRVTFFDVSRVGRAPPPPGDGAGDDDDDDAPPELVFAHGGHKAAVSEFSLSEEDRWLCASVSEDNFLQVWCVGEHIFEDEDEGAPQPPKPPTPQPSPAKRNAPASPGKSLVESVCSAMPVPSPAKKVKVIGGDDAKEDA
ncbi:hypothetical protein JL722_6453 [Aureococcus anophagefferens]|nr:hypothetical protein JL722_6453 [Aureococcus anophagefferens]